MLIGGPHNTYAAHNKDPAHFSLKLYTRAGENAPRENAFPRRPGTALLLFQKRTIEDFAVSKMRVVRDALLRPRRIAERAERTAAPPQSR